MATNKAQLRLKRAQFNSQMRKLVSQQRASERELKRAIDRARKMRK